MTQAPSNCTLETPSGPQNTRQRDPEASVLEAANQLICSPRVLEEIRRAYLQHNWHMPKLSEPCDLVHDRESKPFQTGPSRSMLSQIKGPASDNPGPKRLDFAERPGGGRGPGTCRVCSGAAGFHWDSRVAGCGTAKTTNISWRSCPCIMARKSVM